MTWRARALAAGIMLADTGQPFTSDDIIDRVGPPDPDHTANGANNTVGSIFRQLANDGVIETDGRVVRSRQPHRKGGAIRVWRGTTGQGRLL